MSDNQEEPNQKKLNILLKNIGQYDYLGWIPNLKSNLLFDITNDTNLLNPVSNFIIIGYADKYIANIKFDSKKHISRLIVATGLTEPEDIKSDDSKNYFTYLRYFVYLKQASNSNNLVGQIMFVHSDSPKPCDNQLKIIKHFNELDSLSKEYDEFVNKGKTFTELNKHMERIYEKKNELDIETIFKTLQTESESAITKKLNGKIFFLVDTEILKTGISLFKLNSTDKDMQVAFHDNDIHDHQIPRHYKIILSLLKDIFHTHSFHRNNQDSIIGCSKILKDCHSVCSNINDIINNQFNFLHSNILERMKNPKNYFAEKLIFLDGISSYQNAYINSFGNLGLIEDAHKTELNNAVENMNKAVKAKQSLFPLRITNFIIIFLGYIAISATVYGAFTDKVKEVLTSFSIPPEMPTLIIISIVLTLIHYVAFLKFHKQSMALIHLKEKILTYIMKFNFLDETSSFKNYWRLYPKIHLIKIILYMRKKELIVSTFTILLGIFLLAITVNKHFHLDTVKQSFYDFNTTLIIKKIKQNFSYSQTPK